MGIQSFSNTIGGESFVIFACDGGVLEQQQLIAFMEDNNIDRKALVGAYKMLDGETVTEHSWLVSVDDFIQIQDCGFVDQQESFLELGPCNSLSKRPAKLVYNDPTREPLNLGLFQSVPEEEAKAQDNWTYSIELMTYFICKEENHEPEKLVRVMIDKVYHWQAWYSNSVKSITEKQALDKLEKSCWSVNFISPEVRVYTLF